MQNGRVLLSVITTAAALLASVFTSCVTDPVTPSPDDPVMGKGGDDKVTFIISVPRTNLPSTRAIDEGGVADNQVDEVTFLLFDTQTGLYVDYAQATNIEQLAESNKKRFTVKLPEGAYNALILANSDYLLTGDFDLNANAATLQTEDKTYFEQNLINTMALNKKWNADLNSTTELFRPFPMSAYFNIPADHTQLTNITPAPVIQLTRMLAKINVDASAVSSAFKLQEIRLCNYNRSGTVIQPVITEALSVFGDCQVFLNVPAEPNCVTAFDYALIYNGNAINTTNNSCIDEIFLNEVAYTNDINSICVVIKGQLASGAARWFRINFRITDPEDGIVKSVNIMRNFRYTVNITAVSGNGFATPEEAFESPAEGLITELTAIDESDMNDITFDGRNQLVVNKSQFTFESDGTSQTIKIYTDYTNGWKIENISDSWIVAPATSIEGAGLVTTPADITCEANTGTTVRTATFLITAGTLRKVITVIQNPALLPGVPAPPGVIGYFASGPRKGQLTLRGSKEYAGTLVDTNSPFGAGQLEKEQVFVAYFKWASLVAVSIPQEDDSFDKSDVVWAPAGYQGTVSDAAALNYITSAIGTNSNSTVAWAVIPGVSSSVTSTTGTVANSLFDINAGLGDPCAYYFDNNGNISYNAAGNNVWRLPVSDATTPWNNGSFGTIAYGSVTWPLSNGAAWIVKGTDSGTGKIPADGAVAGTGSGPDWSMFLPAAGIRAGGSALAVTANATYWANKNTTTNGYIGQLRSTSALILNSTRNVYDGVAIRCVRP